MSFLSGLSAAVFQPYTPDAVAVRMKFGGQKQQVEAKMKQLCRRRIPEGATIWNNLEQLMHNYSRPSINGMPLVQPATWEAHTRQRDLVCADMLSGKSCNMLQLMFFTFADMVAVML